MFHLDTKNPQTIRKLALAALTIASIIWGVNTPIMKYALQVTPLFLLAFLRFFLASIVLLFFKPSLKIAKKDIPLIVAAALTGVTINITFFFYGLLWSSAINAAIIIAAIPIFTLVGAVFFLKERVKPNLVVASILGTLGLVVIVLDPIFGGEVSASIVGNLFLLLSAVGWVGYEIISKKLFIRYSPATVTFYSFLIGSLTFLPFCYSNMLTIVGGLILDHRFLIGLSFGVLFTSALSYFLWQWGLSKINASRVGFFFYIDPIVGTVASVLLLGEHLTGYVVGGSILIFAGLYLAELKIPYHHLFHHNHDIHLASNAANRESLQ